MKRDTSEILSSLLDAEPVDAVKLSECLSDPDNQALLSDMALLRATLIADSTTPSVAFERRMESALRAPAFRGTRWTGWAAAAVVVLGVGLVLVLGVRGRSGIPSTDLPPDPDRVLSFSEHGSWS